MFEKELVEVALVLVLFVAVNPPLKASCVVVALLGNRYVNGKLEPEVIQVPFIEKHPPARLIPPVA